MRLAILPATSRMKLSAVAAPVPQRVRDDQLGIGVNGCPRPDAARSGLYLLQGQVLVLTLYEGPNFVGLDATHAEVSHVGIVIGSASTAHVFKQFKNSMLCSPGHPTGGVY